MGIRASLVRTLAERNSLVQPLLTLLAAAAGRNADRRGNSGYDIS